LLAHQQVVEAVMRVAPVLPVKFGTQAPDETSVRHALEQGRSSYQEAFARLADCMQMEVVVLWDLDAVFRDIAAEGAIVQLKSEIAASPEQQREAACVTLGGLVKAALDRRRRELATHLADALRGVAIDAVDNAVMNDRMVLNLALLLRRNDGERLDRRLSELDAEHVGRLTFRCVGPLPPYSFATVEIRFPTFDEVERSRRALELGEKATAAELRSAYRRLVKTVHPDAAGVGRNVGARMSVLTDAYRVLNAYAGGRAGGDAEAPPLRFDRRAVAQRVLISVRRQESVAANFAPSAVECGG
jgi:DnaJ-domain-containing protein 1